MCFCKLIKIFDIISKLYKRIKALRNNKNNHVKKEDIPIDKKCQKKEDIPIDKKCQKKDLSMYSINNSIISIIDIQKNLIINEEIITKPYIEQSSVNNIEQSSVNNIEQSSVNNIEQSSINNIEQSSTNNIEQSSFNNIEQSTVNNIEQSSINNIEQSSVIDLEKEIINNKDIKLDICNKDENYYSEDLSEEKYYSEDLSEENFDYENEINRIDEKVNTKLFIGIQSDEIESITDSTQYSEKSSNFEFEMIDNETE